MTLLAKATELNLELVEFWDEVVAAVGTLTSDPASEGEFRRAQRRWWRTTDGTGATDAEEDGWLNHAVWTDDAGEQNDANYFGNSAEEEEEPKTEAASAPEPAVSSDDANYSGDADAVADENIVRHCLMGFEVIGRLRSAGRREGLSSTSLHKLPHGQEEGE